MTKTAKTLIWAGLVVLSLAVAGCWGAMKTSPDNPTGAGGLTPNVEDKDAGLVALAPGFDVSGWLCRNLIPPLSQPRYTLLTLRPMV